MRCKACDSPITSSPFKQYKTQHPTDPNKVSIKKTQEQEDLCSRCLNEIHGDMCYEPVEPVELDEIELGLDLPIYKDDNY